ncbi:hypothetical protein DPMN_103083 [Dreissena polymorpha]|uniref:Uncharacterized protein n=1 Tax=Dreissena polymorpha TaxID=45954 RepID=A0A9D4H786_DREPO|nr:hypothetical protein DPMN_103083 [Dreissena polymorpha]
MEDIGVTEETVEQRRNIYIQTEKVRYPMDSITGTALSEPEVFKLAVGSQVEGSTTHGMNSDVDMMYVSQYLKVVLQGQETEGAAVVVKDKMCYLQCCFLKVSPETEINIP